MSTDRNRYRGNDPWNQSRYKDEKTVKKGVFSSQIAVCLLILAVLGIGRAFDLPWYRQSQSFVQAQLSAPDQTEQVQAVLAQVTGWAYKPSVPQQNEPSADQKLDRLKQYIRQYGKDPSAIDGQGGRFSVSVLSAAVGKPPENCLLTPITVSQKPYLPLDYSSVTGLYGFRQHPISGETDFHTGIDLAAPMGARVACAWSGKVEETGWSDVYGNWVLVSHSSGLATFYAHLSRITVKQGMYLREGEQIGEIGSTGISTGPHLHWEVRFEGKRVDPAWLLGRYCVQVG